MLYDVGSVKRRDKIRQEMLKRRTVCDRPLRGFDPRDRTSGGREERGIKTLRISDSVDGRISSDSDSAGSSYGRSLSDPLVRHGVREVREAKRFLSDPQGFDLECLYERDERCERNDRRDSFERENSLYEWRGRESAHSGRSGISEREVRGDSRGVEKRGERTRKGSAESGRSGISEREVRGDSRGVEKRGERARKGSAQSGRSGISGREVRGDSLEGEMCQDYTALKDSSSSDSKKSDGEERRSVFGEEERRSVFGEEERRSVFGEEERRSVFGEEERRSVFGEEERRSVFGEEDRRESCGSCSDSW